MVWFDRYGRRVHGRHFFEQHGLDVTSIEEMVMPKYKQTTNNMGMAWLAMNKVRFRLLWTGSGPMFEALRPHGLRALPLVHGVSFVFSNHACIHQS